MTLILLSASVVASVLLASGVHLAQWSCCLLVIGLAAVTSRVRTPAVGRTSTALLSLIGCVAILQIVPLPAVLVGLLSPARLELSEAVATVAGPAPSFLTLSAVPYETAQQVMTLCAYGLLFVLIRAVAVGYQSAWVTVWPLLLIAAIESPIGISQTPVAIGTYASYDHYAGLLEMILPFALMYAIAILRGRDRGWTRAAKAWLILTIAALMLAAILHTHSRMGYFASLVALVICGYMSFSMRWRIPAIGVIVVLAFIYLPDEPFVARFSNLWGDVRFKIWPDTVGLVKAFPLFGCGLGGYKSCFMRFQTVAPMNTVDYAHNDYLQILAEFGLIAFLAGLLFAARLLRATIRRSIHAPSQDHRLLAIACTASLVAMLLHSFVDFNLYVPANGAVFAWICGIAATHCREI